MPDNALSWAAKYVLLPLSRATTNDRNERGAAVRILDRKCEQKRKNSRSASRMLLLHLSNKILLNRTFKQTDSF